MKNYLPENKRQNCCTLFKTRKCFFFIFLIASLLYGRNSFSVTYTVTNTLDAGAGSLRQAILDANANVGNDQVIFNLGAGGPFTITLLSALPLLTDNAGVTIDGWNNSGNDGIPNTVAVFSTSVGTPLNPVYKIILDNGANIPVGISASGGNNMIRGLVLQNFGDGVPSNNDIAISLASANNTVVGCYIGMDITGTIAGTLTNIGIRITSGNNKIGDGTKAGVNLLSGLINSGYKIYISGATATANIIKGNIIGLKADGTTIITGTTSSGIYLITSANSNTIGGVNSEDGNLISGNRSTGISVGTNSNVIQGNYIGPLSDGMSGLVGTMQSNGLNIWGQYNLLGGSVVGARNLISGNTNLGMDMSGHNNIIKGNYWGPNKLGTARLSVSNNSGMAVNGGTGTVIGGNLPGEGNLMSGLPGMAIWLLYNVGPVTTSIKQNTIGLAANGTSSLTGGGNGTGILMMLNTSNNIIGGSTSADRNIISGNSTGISMSSNCGGGNLIRGNYIGIAGNGTNRVIGASQGSGISVTSVSITTAISNTIGGTGAGDGNLISGNTTNGILLSGTASSLTTVLQNTIGPQANGTSTITGGASQSGINMINSHTNIIGGTTSASRNIISANNQGVIIDGVSAKRNKVMGNFIGPGSGGVAITGATQSRGVVIQNSASSNTVGGYLGNFGANPMGNVIANNTSDGIYIFSVAADSNLISRNLIYLNGAASKPINLNYGANQGNSGKTVPVIMTVTTSVVTGSAAATGGVGDTVEVFANTTGNCRDMMTYKGSTLADAVGNWTLSGITINNGESVVATARTVANHNTGEASICTVPLPIELLYFNAVCTEDKKTKLNWASASERGSDYFIIERSDDGINYKYIGKIKAAGTNNRTVNYFFVDEEPVTGISYYRLKQTDLDKNFKYYNKVFISDCFNKQTKILVFPNPAQDYIYINFSATRNEPVNIEIFDMMGKSLLNRNFNCDPENNSFEIKTEDLPKGIYFIKIILPSGTEQIKFLKN